MPGERRDGAAARAPRSAVAAAEALAREYDPEPAHFLQVRRNAINLFDATAELHGLGTRERELLEAAALLHDTGYSNRPEEHHKGSRDLIMEKELPGFTGREQRIIACVARYHRKAHPKAKHRIYRDLNQEDALITRKLAALLRIGDGLDRAHEASVRDLWVERRAGGIRIHIRQRRPSPADVFGAEKKRQLFEEIFGLRVDIVPEMEPSEFVMD